MEVGTRIQYKRAFLKSIGAYAGPMPFAKGKITEIKLLGKELAIASIAWEKNSEELPGRVNVKNLQKIK